jgi:hypothetical protein
LIAHAGIKIRLVPHADYHRVGDWRAGVDVSEMVEGNRSKILAAVFARDVIARLAALSSHDRQAPTGRMIVTDDCCIRRVIPSQIIHRLVPATASCAKTRGTRSWSGVGTMAAITAATSRNPIVHRPFL